MEFDYEYDIYGKEKTRITFNLSVAKFFYANKDLDMAIIGIEEKYVSGTYDVRQRGYLVLNETLGKIGKGDFASIIQHPEGKPKMVGLRENKISPATRFRAEFGVTPKEYQQMTTKSKFDISDSPDIKDIGM